MPDPIIPDEPKKAALLPDGVTFQCPDCGHQEIAELDEDEYGVWRVPDDRRFMHCDECNAFIDVGWSGWGGLTP
jgi:hypothetical protein